LNATRPRTTPKAEQTDFPDTRAPLKLIAEKTVPGIATAVGMAMFRRPVIVRTEVRDFYPETTNPRSYP
jgi:hypothetical protein